MENAIASGVGKKQLRLTIGRNSAQQSVHISIAMECTVKPTDEQEEIISLAPAKENLQIVAYAGTGKTATLRMLAERLDGPILYCAFNKRIIEEAEELKDFPGECRTLNSIGHRVWMRTIPGRVTIDAKKTYNIFKQVV